MLGREGIRGSATPLEVPGLTGALSVAAGTAFSMALRSGGTVWTWGQGRWGQLGSPDFPAAGATRATPAQVPGLENITAISTSLEHALALRDHATVWAWGTNTWGQVGDGTTDFLEEAIQVQGITSGVTSIALGDRHTLAIHPDGTLWSWGNNSDGQLARG